MQVQTKENGCLGLLSAAVIKHLGQKQPWEERVCLAYVFRSQSIIRETEAGTLTGQGLGGRN